MGVETDEKERCPVSMHISNKSTVVDISADVGD